MNAQRVTGLPQPVLTLDNVSVSFPLPGPRWPWQTAGRVLAVDGVSLAVAPGEMVGIVGESGCGKSTLARVAVGLLPPEQGSRHTPLDALGIQLIFQDASAALNPRRTVAQQLIEAPLVHGLVPRHAASEAVSGLLQRVGLDPSLAGRYPHQLSGGQKARVAIARALGVQPRLLVCDEILASLDVVLQAQMVELLRQLQQRDGLACLFISHDLAMVRRLCQRVAVMQAGRLIEIGRTEEVMETPAHPWTRQLLAAMPRLYHLPQPLPERYDRAPEKRLTGCSHQQHCPWCDIRCCQQRPDLYALSPTHQVACHYSNEVLSPGPD